MSDDQIQPGALVRRKSDGAVDLITRREWAEGIKHNRFEIVVFQGVVHLPREFEVMEEA